MVEGQLARELGLLPADSAARTPLGTLLPTEQSFAQAQLRNPRVLEARIATRFRIKRLFEERGLRYPAAEVFMRIFKRERTLELWVRPEGSETFSLLKRYDICALAGGLGPKRQQGDSQVPEGFYTIDFFNPESDYHLSLHVDYPNVRDRVEGVPGVNLGGDIYIHGGCSSEGCLAVTDEGIMELYWLAVEARAVGQERIPVHIFPARLDAADLARLREAFADAPELGEFWASLKPGYDFFEENRRVPAIMVDGTGDYIVTGAAENASVAVRMLEPEPVGMPVGPVVEQPKKKVPLGSKIGG